MLLALYIGDGMVSVNKEDDIKEPLDVRILTLKRWNHYQNRPIFGSDCNRGDYVSFQNYHYVDISEVEDNGEDILTAAYDFCQQTRANNGWNANEQKQDVYIQQSMVLLGEKSDFWKTKPKILFITMLQLSDQEKINFKNLKSKIAELFRKEKIEPQNWALYYSLDFCDLILLAKDTQLNSYQDVLWKLSPVRGAGGLNLVRDTITVYSVAYNYLYGKFKNFKSSVVPKDNSETKTERFSLTVFLSVQSYSCWKNLEREFEKIKAIWQVKIDYFRILGRYDLQVMVDQVTLEQSLYLIYLIDLQCQSKRHAFGGYEMIPMIDSYKIRETGIDAPHDKTFQRAARGALGQLYREYHAALHDANQDLWGYAAEIRRSLLALSKNGFAEEFVLSVLHSFAEYLLFVTEKMKCDNQQVEKLYQFQREYFQAISMLMHCTMHSERQFIQAPAFNAILCDVPPKLLAFYASVAYSVTNQLHDEDNRTFSFLIAPDFRPDIYVKTISYGAADENKISIIYLNEKQFYDPRTVVPIMCHEIAHYVGNMSRHRDRRMELIFNAVCAFLLYNMLPLDEKTGEGKTPPLLAPLAEAFGTLLKEKYTEFSQSFYVNDIDRFLIQNNTIMTLVESLSFQAKLRQAWADVLIHSDIGPLLDKLDRTLRSHYSSSLYQDGVREYYDGPNTARQAACNIMADNMVLKLQKSFRLWKRYGSAGQEDQSTAPLEIYFDFCQLLIQACSEAYSDLRMIELLGIQEASQYENILIKNTEYRVKANVDFQRSLRHDAVCEACNLKSWSAYFILSDLDPTMQVVIKYARSSLVKYLRECIRNKQDDSAALPHGYLDLNKIMKQLESHDAEEIFSTIRSTMIDYRKMLIQYCKEVEKNHHS